MRPAGDLNALQERLEDKEAVCVCVCVCVCVSVLLSEVPSLHFLLRKMSFVNNTAFLSTHFSLYTFSRAIHVM